MSALSLPVFVSTSDVSSDLRIHQNPHTTGCTCPYLSYRTVYAYVWYVPYGHRCVTPVIYKLGCKICLSSSPASSSSSSSSSSSVLLISSHLIFSSSSSFTSTLPLFTHLSTTYTSYMRHHDVYCWLPSHMGRLPGWPKDPPARRCLPDSPAHLDHHRLNAPRSR